MLKERKLFLRNKKNLIVFALLFLSSSIFSAELKAKDVMMEAAKKSSVKDSISYINTQISKTTVLSEKRSLYIFLGGLQEQLSLYQDALKSYAAAAGITASNAEGMPKKSNEQLVLDAVRCALCVGDSATADKYLNSAVRNSKNDDIQLYIKLYTQWSALCNAETEEDLQEPLELLKAYLKVSNMKKIHSVILLTLWYVTGDTSYSDRITKEFPNSTEASIVSGDIQLLPTPFWFFVPKSGVAEVGSGTFVELPVEQKIETETKSESKEQEKVTTAPKFSKWQVGFFSKKEYADNLCKELKDKKFDAQVQSEKRASGTVYYIVAVKEDSEGTVADKLRSAGYDCYPIE